MREEMGGRGTEGEGDGVGGSSELEGVGRKASWDYGVGQANRYFPRNLLPFCAPFAIGVGSGNSCGLVEGQGWG